MGKIKNYEKNKSDYEEEALTFDSDVLMKETFDMIVDFNANKSVDYIDCDDVGSISVEVPYFGMGDDSDES